MHEQVAHSEATEKAPPNDARALDQAVTPAPLRTRAFHHKARTKITTIWKQPKSRQRLLISFGLLVALLIGDWIIGEFSVESTDDAFVSAHVHMVSSRISGTVVEVAVRDNQIVKKGDLLVRLDPKDFEVQRKMAEANDLKAKLNLKRWEGQQALHPNEILQKNIDLAESLATEAQLEAAQLNLQYSEIRAAEEGKVGNRNVETGQQVQVGQALMALVEPVPWVIANFKEHQAARLQPGQTARIRVDAIAGHEFTGHVDSIAPGSGATFSLLPPDNATGNFTKIVQRIPVKIVFDPTSIQGFENRLTTGMSVSVMVNH